MMNLIYKMCSRHDINEIMLYLAFSKQIMFVPSSSISLLQLSCGTSD